MKLTKQEKSWILYDSGNSAYSIAISTALFPIVFGMFDNVSSSMSLGYFSSLASIIIAVLSPILGTIADYKDKKKRFFIFFFILGVIGTASLALIPPESGQWQILILFYVISSIGFSGANIFYDAFLVDITKDERMDRVSSIGYGYGYIASIIPFGLCLGLILLLGMDNPLGYQIGFLITAVWWSLFTIPFLRHVRQQYYVKLEPKPIINSFKRIITTFIHIKQYKIVFIFLLAYFFYIDGVDTIITMVVPYATSVLGGDMDVFTLLTILLIIQIIAFPFAILYGRLANKYSTKTLLVAGIVTYVIACISAYFISSIWHVFILGMMIGSAQGGVQALSRSYYAKIIPKEKSNEFFGFYNIFGKFAAIIGPFLMALTTTLTGEPRLSILSIIPLFIIGLVLLLLLPKDASQKNNLAG